MVITTAAAWQIALDGAEQVSGVTTQASMGTVDHSASSYSQEFSS
jgi:hypothetical protein